MARIMITMAINKSAKALQPPPRKLMTLFKRFMDPPYFAGKDSRPMQLDRRRLRLWHWKASSSLRRRGNSRVSHLRLRLNWRRPLSRARASVNDYDDSPQKHFGG